MSEERRQGDSDLKQAVALLQKDMEYIKLAIDTNLADFKEHIRTSEPIREKVSSIDSFKKSFDEHITSDRWCFSLVVTVQLAILSKLMGAW